MSLISTHGTVKWGSGNKQIYEQLGYKFTFIGDKFEVPIEQLSPYSNAIVKVGCDFCERKYDKTFKDYNALRGDKYCCPVCLKHKKKIRNENGKLEFIEIPYRNYDWLFNEYITKDRMAQDIAKDCGINTRTLREWICLLNIPDKHQYKQRQLTKEILEELYQKKHMTSEEIAKLYNVSDRTVIKMLRQYNISIPTRKELLDIYYNKKGGREKAQAIFGAEENRIKISCRQRDLSVDEFDGFITDEARRLRTSSEYKEWQYLVFERDNYICQKCKRRGGNLNAHHIYNFKSYPSKRFEVDNGITLCEECHLVGHPNSFHTLYGEKNNTPEQLYEFLGGEKYLSKKEV